MRFSQRAGITPKEFPIQINSVNTELRNSIWSAVYTYFFSHIDQGAQWETESVGTVAQLAQVNFFKLPIDDLPEYGFQYLDWIKDWFNKAKWYELYDYVEWLGNYGSHWDAWRDGRTEHDNARAFRESVNTILERENSGYRFVGDLLAPVTNASEVSEIQKAESHLGKFGPVATHISAALELLSDRKNPDFRNSIKESISAVESTAKLLTGDPKATLGDALKTLSKETDLHSALKDGFSKLYGWTSDANGIRHSLMEVPNISLADARFMLVACSAFANYLIDRAAVK